DPKEALHVVGAIRDKAVAELENVHAVPPSSPLPRAGPLPRLLEGEYRDALPYSQQTCMRHRGRPLALGPIGPHVDLAARPRSMLQKRIGLASAAIRLPSVSNKLHAPSRVLQGFKQDACRIGVSVGDSSEPNDKRRSLGCLRGRIPPHGSKVSGEVLRAPMRELTASTILDFCWAPDEP